jgi:hypothetical protein
MPVFKNKAELEVGKLSPGTYTIGCYKDGARISSGSFIKQ